MCAEDSFGPRLSAWHLDLLAARPLVQIVDDVVVVVGAIIVHVSILQKLWPRCENQHTER